MSWALFLNQFGDLPGPNPKLFAQKGTNVSLNISCSVCCSFLQFTCSYRCKIQTINCHIYPHEHRILSPDLKTWNENRQSNGHCGCVEIFLLHKDLGIIYLFITPNGSTYKIYKSIYKKCTIHSIKGNYKLGCRDAELCSSQNLVFLLNQFAYVSRLGYTRMYLPVVVKCTPVWMNTLVLITFRVSRRRREMYCVTRVCVCVSVRGRMAILLHGPGCNLGEWYRGFPLVVHYWADLQSVHGLCW